MHVVGCLIYRWREDRACELYHTYNLSKVGYFQRKTVEQFVKFHARAVVSRTSKGQRQSVQFEENIGKCHVYVAPSGLACAVLTDGEYPMRVAYQMISEVMRAFAEANQGQWEAATQDMKIPFKNGETLLERYQDPSEADKISKIEKDLDEVKGIVIKSMDDILRRGETLDALMQKSEDLSQTSYQFYRTAKQNNQCCKLY